MNHLRTQNYKDLIVKIDVFRVSLLMLCMIWMNPIKAYIKIVLLYLYDVDI